MIIQVKAQHATGREIRQQIEARYGIREVDDSVAVAVAAQWQSPGTVGRYLAALASGAPVDHHDLLEDISVTRRLGDADGWLTGQSRQELDMLTTWVHAHVFRASQPGMRS